MATIQTEDRSLIRDTHSKALLNTDRSALERHRIQMKKANEQNAISIRVQRLEARMDEIATMLHQTLSLLRVNNG